MPRKKQIDQGPRTHQQFRVRARAAIVNVHPVDWAKVLAGEKTMFRSYNRRVGQPEIMPTPCVAWRYRTATDVDSHPLLMVETYQEPLGAITPEDLADEGFADLGEFRRYFEVRYPNGGFRPLAMVQVYRVRPLADDDIHEWGWKMAQRFGYVR